MNIKNIQTKRFTLRVVEKNDTQSIFKMLSNKNIIQNLNMDIHKTIEDTKNLVDEYIEKLKKEEMYPFAIINPISEELIGIFLIKLDIYDEDCFEFTIYIDEKFWNKGVYQEILPYMIKFTFEDIKVGNFRGFIKEKNIASAVVLEKNNFVLEKIFEVPKIEGKIKSYLMTKEMYRTNCK